jgi:hypothetical protein
MSHEQSITEKRIEGERLLLLSHGAINTMRKKEGP